MNTVADGATTRGALRVARAVAPLLAATALIGCVIPVPGGGVSSEVSAQSVAAIAPGTSTRADVLLRLADPTLRGNADSYFVYAWQQSHAGAIFAFPYPFAEAHGESCHRLVIRFAADGGVAKVGVFHGEIQLQGSLFVANSGSDVCRTDTALNARIDAWLAEPAPAAE